MRVALLFLGFSVLLLAIGVSVFVWLFGQLILGLWKPDQGLL